MATIEVILRDDDGNVIGASTNQSYGMDLGQQTLHEIEGEVERFKQQALPEIEKTLLEHAQAEFTEEKKNDIGGA
ncbi:MAG: hypothetical protein AAGC93_30815 [Cyanobacteria bacterium P01_F01_bin.53]